MITTARGRLVVVVLLLAAHGALFPLYATQPVNPDAGRFPDSDEFLSEPNRYLGDRVTAGGVVISTDPLVLRVGGSDEPTCVEITDSKLSPEVGDKVRAFGILTDSKTISATDAFAVPRRGLWYAWSVSVLAGLWTLWRLVAHWTVDPSTLAFQPRERPLTLARLVSGGERDG